MNNIKNSEDNNTFQLNDNLNVDYDSQIKKYNKIDNIRRGIMISAYQNGKTISEIMVFGSLSKSTITSIIKIFLKSGEIQKKTKR